MGVTEYQDFLDSKHLRVANSGFSVKPKELNPHLFDWQRLITQWSIRRGRAALWLDTGLGKTICQLDYSRCIIQRENKPALILAPLAVTRQTCDEAVKFGIDAHCPIVHAASQADVKEPGIYVTNYEKLHLFDASKFCSVVLDESGILKAFTGATKRKLCADFADTPYRLACTATPAPNDRMELGNHSEFLGIMRGTEMLARWFINTGKSVGKYTLRPYAADDFWRWMASWAVCISRPSDIGFTNAGCDLPPLRVHEHIVAADTISPGMLFNVGKDVSATEVHQEKRANLVERVAKVASLVNGDKDAWAVWCDTDYESEALCHAIPDALEVKGSHSAELKTERLEAFRKGQARVIVTKADIGGWGLNWQHAHKTTWFAGFRFEAFYQAVRRLYRFGQTQPVDVHIVMTENEQSIKKILDRKAAQHTELHCEMAQRMKDCTMEELFAKRTLKRTRGSSSLQLPCWLISHEGE